MTSPFINQDKDFKTDKGEKIKPPSLKTSTRNLK